MIQITISIILSLIILGCGHQNLAAQPNEFLGFEDIEPGIIESLKSPMGLWVPEAGISKIDNKHAKSGNQCLHISGGKESILTITFSKGVDTSGELSFWVERWTRRNPFTFRIEKMNDSVWEQIYDGDNSIRVGRSFLTHVSIPLEDDKIKKLRFKVSSPESTGVLIDDLRIAPYRPQRIVNTESIPITFPALVGTKSSLLTLVKIETKGSINPIALTEVQTTVFGSPKDVDYVECYLGTQSQFTSQNPFGSRKKLHNTTSQHVFDGQQFLQPGTNYLWIACKVNQTANIDHQIGARIHSINTSNGSISISGDFQPKQRMGIALRSSGDDGVHTYRIPGLVTTNKGTLIGVYDIRHRSSGDLPGDIDVGMSRSTDGGHTWAPMKVIMDMGRDPNWQYDGIGDPAILVDRKKGTIWVASTWSHGNRSWVGSGPGLKPDETGQLMLVRSDDDGLTWSQPINITEQIKNPEWSFILQGPGKGISMRDGTLVFAAQYQDPPNKKDPKLHRLPHSTIIYSKDHGTTWQVGTGAFDDTTESQVIEMEPGVLMLNCRYNRSNTRVVMITRDMGDTWEEHPTSRKELIEPRACMASLIHLDHEIGKASGSRLLFSNPNSIISRQRITIKSSLDNGLSWSNQLLLDQGNGRGYSCLTMIDEKTIGILYEGSQADMTFQRIPISDLIP